MPALTTIASDLRAIGLAHGLHDVGFASAEPFADTLADLLDRRERGLHDDMQFTYRNPARSTDPERALAGVATLVVGARAYPPPSGAGRENPPADAVEDGRPQARVASYVVGDHYGALRAGLDAIAEHLIGAGHRARVLLDDNALVDRAAAHRAGLGWFGKNANLLLPGVGSWVVLGSVLTDASLPVAPEPMPDGCGACTRCLDGCPTGAIVEPGVVDARRCLAWQVQARGTFPPALRAALGDRIYGCDECQEVCPPSRRATGAGSVAIAPPSVRTTAPALDVLALLAADDRALVAEVGRWYIADRNLDLVRRNALIVLGNVAPLPISSNVVETLRSYLHHRDPLLRAHAAWAARRLDRGDLVGHLTTDPAPEVRAELARPVPPRAGSSPPSRAATSEPGTDVR